MASSFDYSQMATFEDQLKRLFYSRWYAALGRQCTREEYNYGLRVSEEWAKKKAIELMSQRELDKTKGFL
jgi:hypothetical protein